MDVQQMAPQQQEPKRPSIIWVRVSSGFVTFLALLWRLIIWIWGFLVIAAIAGVLGNAAFTYFMTGKVNFQDPRTLTIVAWLSAHFVPCAALLALTLVVTLCSYLAHYRKQRLTQENQRVHDDALVVIGRGVQRALDELNTKPSVLPTSLPVPANEDTASPKELWNVPYRRNPFFTGREDLLKQLRDHLTSSSVAALTQAQAISGLGGIGKTQTAVEYAYRYRDEYRAVLWVNAATRETLITSYADLAAVLTLPEYVESDQSKVKAAVMRWLSTHEGWLLILDNIEDLSLIHQFVPVNRQGAVLLTTRRQVTEPVAQALELGPLPENDGILFLLKRSKTLTLERSLEDISPHIMAAARPITQALGNLPLALDQAGAYILETNCGLSNYLDLFKKHQVELLRRRVGQEIPTDHPESVATTFSLNFQQVQQQSVVAIELLRVCAFLAPDNIGEEIFVQGASELGPVLQPLESNGLLLNQAMEALRIFSLIQRDPAKKMLSIHRLVQAVLQDTMSGQDREMRVERVIAAMNTVFPRVEYATWDQCERLVSQALACATLLKQQTTLSLEGAELFHKTGLYLLDRARYKEAEPLFLRIAATFQLFIPDHSNTAIILYNLARAYYQQGRYAEAEPLFLQARAIDEKALGEGHLNMAIHDHGLALLYKEQGHYTEAERLYWQALTIREGHLGKEHRDLAEILSSLGKLYTVWGKFKEAEPLLQRAVDLQGGLEHPEAMTSLSNLAEIYYHTGRDAEAEPLYQQILQFRETQVGPTDPSTATTLYNLARLYLRKGQYQKAESYARRALEIYESTLGQEHPFTAASLHCLAALSYQQGRCQEAATYWQRALAICGQQIGPESPPTALCLHGLAMVSYQQGRFQEAETLLQRALAIQEPLLGLEHPDTIQTVKDYAHLLRTIGRESEAKRMEARIDVSRRNGTVQNGKDSDYHRKNSDA